MAFAQGITESEFFMWRALVAFAFADNIFSVEEQELLRSYFRSVSFSPRQREILQEDFRKPPNVEAMYKKITDKKHKERFCVLARGLAWCEGDMDRQEREILKRIGCMRGADEEVLRSSRDHPDFQTVYEHYMRAGVVGLSRNYRVFEARV